MKGKGGQIAAAAAAAAAATGTKIGSTFHILTNRTNQIGTCRRNDTGAGTGTGASIIYACSALSIISSFLLCAFGTCENCIPIQQFQMHQYVISKE